MLGWSRRAGVVMEFYVFVYSPVPGSLVGEEGGFENISDKPFSFSGGILVSACGHWLV